MQQSGIILKRKLQPCSFELSSNSLFILVLRYDVHKKIKEDNLCSLLIFSSTFYSLNSVVITSGILQLLASNVKYCNRFNPSARECRNRALCSEGGWLILSSNNAAKKDPVLCNLRSYSRGREGKLLKPKLQPCSSEPFSYSLFILELRNDVHHPVRSFLTNILLDFLLIKLSVVTQVDEFCPSLAK